MHITCYTIIKSFSEKSLWAISMNILWKTKLHDWVILQWAVLMSDCQNNSLAFCKHFLSTFHVNHLNKSHSCEKVSTTTFVEDLLDLSEKFYEKNFLFLQLLDCKINISQYKR